VVREVDVYGCMSRFGLRILEEEYGRDGVLTPGGVNTDELMPAPARASQPTILFSGALDEPHKGVARLLRAAAVVRRRHPGLRVWLSGPGDATALIAGAPAEVRDAVDALPIGGSGDQAERYGRAWVTALPSYGDSFGMAILESLACGTPVVAGNDAALPELVSPGVTGVLCDPGSDDSVAEALVQALDISSRPGTTAACRASAERFDWKNLAADFSRLYAAGSER
jgi:phosphatidylinositol alpha-mannosyltransferase